MANLKLFSGSFRYRNAAAVPVELDLAVLQREQRKVPPHSDVFAGVKLGSSLPHDDVAGYDGLAAELLNAKALALAVATVLGSSRRISGTPRNLREIP